MEAATPGNGNGIQWRLGNLERRVDKIEALKPDVMAYEIGELGKDMKAVKKLLAALTLTIAGAAISFALTVLSATGKL